MINETVTTVIGEGYKEWLSSDNVILDMAMGRGKTFFITNILGNYAKKRNKKILYLCNRSKLSDEVFNDVKEKRIKSITVKTYQSLQNMIQKGEDICEYNYIVCDECHYLFKDAWNDKTDIMYIWLKNNDTACKIFMSATGHNIFPIIRRWGDCKEYTLSPDYSYIKKVVFYDSHLYIDRVIEQLEEDEKVIYFSRKIAHAYNVYDKYKDIASFNCSKHTKHTDKDKKVNIDYKQHITDDAIVDARLNYKVTCTTSAWDNGINIKDNQLKHIICDFEDLVTLIQAIGRKRVGKIVDGEFVLSEDDNITLHIRKWGKQKLTQFTNPKVATHTECKKYINGDKEWLDEQRISRSKRINQCMYGDYENGELKVNYMRYVALEQEIARLQTAKKMGFDKYIIAALGNSFTGEVEYVYIEHEQKKDSLEVLSEYLDSIVGVKLFKDNQSELKGMFEKAGLKDRTMGINTLNGKLLDENIQYTIKAKKSGSVRYWMVLPVDME